ncbi:Ig-like domain repeat protein [Actinacidiphila glaucinigra]|uniref:Ig-like domain repeat protein n=1 Tax=Actinacidiphila glaucinigra TaxID=235986 RepID=UPI0037128F44
MRNISAATTLAVLFSSVALGVAAAGPASAATATVASPGGIVVDGALQRVFVGDSTAGKILATDYAGNLVDSVSGVAGVTDLTVSDDGTTVYAAAREVHEVMAFDAATLTLKARYTVPDLYGPRYIAFAGGKVWFTYGDQWDGDLGSVDPSVDPAGGTDPVSLGQFSGKVWGQALLDTDPNTPGLLAVGQTGISTDSMAVLDVSGTAPQQVAWYMGDYRLNSGIHDIDLVPGAPQVLVNGTDRTAYADGSFTLAGSYPGGQNADVAANGLVAQASGTNVVVYTPNATGPLRTYPAGTGGAAELAWAPDSSRIFGLVGSNSGYTVKAFTEPGKSQSTLTVSAPATAKRATKITVTGKLTATTALPAGTEVTVTRTDLTNPQGKSLGTKTVASNGTFSFTDTPYTGGTVTYSAHYAGDATHTAALGKDSVAVSRTATSVSIKTNHSTYSYGSTATVTGHLGRTGRSRVLSIYAKASDGTKKLVKSGTVNSSGDFKVTYKVTRNTTFWASFGGDFSSAPKSVSRSTGTQVKVSTSVSRHYRTGKIGSTSYYWFHKNTDPVFTTTMSYYKNRKQRFELQVYYQGKWYGSGSQYFKLATNGKSAVRLEAPGESGIRARMRSSYVKGSSGDSVNTTTHGSWKYMYFTK